MPFGALGAVYAWDRMGHAVVHILNHYLRIILSRYVDDCFGIIDAEDSEYIREATVLLVQWLGPKLDPDKTPAPARSQVILEVRVRLDTIRRREKSYLQARISLEESKAEYWTGIISGILARNHIRSWEAESLAGRLNFVASAILGQEGVCRIRNIYAAQYSGGGISREARHELEWWKHYLQSNPQKKIPLTSSRFKYEICNSDAEGSGGFGGLLLRDEFLEIHGQILEQFSPYFSERKSQSVGHFCVSGYAHPSNV